MQLGEFFRGSLVSTHTSTHVFHRPDEINWIHLAIKMGLSLILAGNLLVPSPQERRT